jgi:hypothetical protein
MKILADAQNVGGFVKMLASDRNIGGQWNLGGR